MKWLFLLVGVVVICFVVALVLGLFGGGLGRTGPSLSHEPLPDEPIEDADFDDLVFDVGARGYRMSQGDAVVDRLRRELREKNEEIAVLRGEDPVPEAAAGEPDEAAPPPDTPDEPRDGSQPGDDSDGRSEPDDEPAAAKPSDPMVERERTT